MDMRNRIVAATLFVVAGFLVAAGLPRFTLSEGYEVADDERVNLAEPTAPPPPEVGEGSGALATVVQLLFIVAILVVAVGLFFPEHRRNLVILFLVTVVFIFAVSLLTTNIDQDFEPVPEEGFASGEAQTAAPENEDVREFVEPDVEPSTEITVAIGAGIILGTAGLVVLLVLYLRKRRAKRAGGTLADSLRDAEEALEAGRRFSEVVIQCFYDMERIIQERRGVPRKRAMTPREFEIVVVHEGAPEDDVDALVRIFETVRYGGVEPGDEDRRRAQAALRRIADAVDAA